MHGESVLRIQPCRSCGSETGQKISEVDYWDIRSTNLVQCDKCKTTQMDPMLTDEETDKGCLAYYIEESLRSPLKEQTKNALRNYRRGIHFAYSLKRKGYGLNNILELGPGSGYFLLGIQYVFPQAKCTVLDVNKEVLDLNAEHGFETVQTTPEHHKSELNSRFDLVIARDIIEHVTDIHAVFTNVYRYLKTGGLFHFITPNGHEDVWRFYIRYQQDKKPAELLINHVNYFDGKGLSDHLTQSGFKEVSYYTYKIKTTIRGRGRKVKPKLMAPLSEKRSADFYINEKMHEIKSVTVSRQDALNKWYLKPGRAFAARIVCWYKHSEWLKINPRINVGHEFFGVFKKS